MPPRPLRVKVKNELGKTCSLPDDQHAFAHSGQGARHLFLGLGPHPENLQNMAQNMAYGQENVLYVEQQQFIDQMDTAWQQAIPPYFQRIRPQELTPERIATSNVWIYTPGLRLFPSFWCPILARLRLCQIPSLPQQQDVVFLPSAHDGLIIPELTRALEHKNIRSAILPEDISSCQLASLLAKVRPKFFMSVNLAGMDAYGERFYLLREAGIPVIVWLVDNPFHLLSKCKAPFWKNIPMGVTDSWFIAPLKKLGARPFHLPLATDTTLFHPRPPENPPRSTEEITFVGRSAFPDKKGFFAGSTLPPALFDQARNELRKGRVPDFAWWLTNLRITNLWPKKDVRKAGLGAEESSLCWRTACLNEAARSSHLTIVGDEGWNKYITHPFTLHHPMDYYACLASWYQHASITLNMTSLLLPQGLTQRHFDVWAAGGFLITDTTPGLNIFPNELTRKISFERPSEISTLIHRFAKESKTKQELRAAWRNEILNKHTYTHRIEKILEIVNE